MEAALLIATGFVPLGDSSGEGEVVAAEATPAPRAFSFFQKIYSTLGGQGDQNHRNRQDRFGTVSGCRIRGAGQLAPNNHDLLPSSLFGAGPPGGADWGVEVADWWGGLG